MSTTTTQDLVAAALRGEPTPQGHDVLIYWDVSDPVDVGPAYRIGYADGREESGPLHFRGWASLGEGPGAQGVNGYLLDCYFEGGGQYLGPDMDGVYPDLMPA